MTQEEVTSDYVTERVRVAGFDKRTETNDNFEDGDISEYGGDTTLFAVTTTQPKEGTYSLESSHASSGSISSTTGLSKYPRQGESFEFWWRTDNAAQADDRAFFATQSETSSPDGYAVHLHGSTSTFELQIYSAGTATDLKGSGQSFTSNTWYRIVVEWQTDGRIVATLYNEGGDILNTIATTDTTYSSGGLGFAHRSADGTTVTTWFDAVKTIDYSGAGLSVGDNSPVETMLANSLREQKPLADDGRLHDTVQKAVVAADSFVFVPPGTFNENIKIDTPGLTLFGAGYSTHINGGNSTHAIQVIANDVTLQSLSVETTGTDTENGDAVSARTGNGTTYVNVTVRDSNARGFDNASSTDNTVYNCRVDGSQQHGILCGTRDIVVGNVIDDTRFSGRNGGQIQAGDDVVIANNIVKNSGDDGLYSTGVDTIITNNQVINPTEDGVQLSGTIDNILSNNRVEAGSQVAIQNDGTTTTLDDNLTGPRT